MYFLKMVRNVFIFEDSSGALSEAAIVSGATVALSWDMMDFTQKRPGN